MKCDYACGSTEHTVARRQFLGQLAAGTLAAGGAGLFASPLAAEALLRQSKRVLLFYMAGGLSQLESWDPKPATPTGGPFRAIPTSVPGVHISELMPKTAEVMDHLLLVRGVNTSEDDHGKGQYMMLTGRRQTPAEEYPRLGAVVAKALHSDARELPGHIHITPGGGGGRSADSAYLGPQFASVVLGNGNPPSHTSLAAGMTEPIDTQRHALRRKLSEHFLARRRTAQTDAYIQSYDQALRLMARRDAFDVSRESAQDQERYGKYDLGRHCLLARRLLEQGALFVQVSHSNYDTHNENFDFHIEQVGEFDRSFSATIRDLHDRGMLESTLVIVMSEFGRTPNINIYYGRDHWSKAWSVTLAGCGIKVGGAYGKTNDHGTEVVDGQVDHAQLFHSYLQAVGIDSTESFDVGGRLIPVADPAHGPVDEILA
jgi:hypothetical protein